jgi:hypothetical protein
MKKYKLKNGEIITKKDMLIILDWCKKKLGRSRFFSIRKLKLRINTNIDFLGLFNIEKNTIHVNPNVQNDLITLIETIIHEYVHFKQNPKEYDRLCRDNSFKYYFDHPHEEEAEKIALSLGKICFFELKKNKIK